MPYEFETQRVLRLAERAGVTPTEAETFLKLREAYHELAQEDVDKSRRVFPYVRVDPGVPIPAFSDMTLDEIKQRAARAGLASADIEYDETDDEIRIIIPRDSTLANRIKRDVISYEHHLGPWGSRGAFRIKKTT